MSDMAGIIGRNLRSLLLQKILKRVPEFAGIYPFEENILR
jgi:hypothetical protein